MRLSKPRSLALAISLMLTFVLTSITFVLMLTIGDIDNWPLLLLFIPLCFGVVFGITYFMIMFFLQNKVRMIYRTMHELRSKKSREVRVKMDTDVLGEINKDAMDWAQERRDEIKELEEREQFRREFIGNLSHELKTPLFNIQGYILTLLEGGLEDETVNREFLGRAARGVDRLTRIVDDMDLISKLESGIMDMKFERIDLMGVIEDTVASMSIRAAEAEMSIKVKKPLDKPLMVMADKARLGQIFMNLLANSIRYGKEGGHVWIDVLDIEGQLWVEVKDDGVGISKQHLPRLFERFYRIGKSRSRHEGGSGLGLAIVKHIIDAHDQTITAASKEGEGTTFTFTLQKAR